ncbi:DUF192 domain-containing protein, partial [Listeria monocytogenes]|uniref:DUF192 domain-containing protein n=1 Tax=Listeria monocytogenes TaxID=1639 RepID=UPI003CCA233E
MGLSGRSSLGINSGMFFIFDYEHLPRFWMKDMQFPIDIVWINKDMKIIGVEKNLNQNTYPNTYSPKEKIKYVLEINPQDEEF